MISQEGIIEKDEKSPLLVNRERDLLHDRKRGQEGLSTQKTVRVPPQDLTRGIRLKEAIPTQVGEK